MGRVYGFKLHLICNEMGELLSFMVTPGNVDDREPLKNKTFVELLFGKLVGDKILLRNRAIIETINDELKNIAQIEPEENGLIQLSLF